MWHLGFSQMGHVTAEIHTKQPGWHPIKGQHPFEAHDASPGACSWGKAGGQMREGRARQPSLKASVWAPQVFLLWISSSSLWTVDEEETVLVCIDPWGPVLDREEMGSPGALMQCYK